MLSIEISANGGPEVLAPVERPVPAVGPGQVLIRQHAIGVNFVDLQHREGRPYPPLNLPFVPGVEAAGTVVACGEGVSGLRLGDRVAYAGPMPGAYADFAAIDAALVVPVPDAVDFDTAAAVLMQGMTAHYLAHDAHVIQPGEYVLVYAAATGVGRLIAAYARSLGAHAAGTSRCPERQAEMRRGGVDLALDADDPDFLQRIRDWSGGGCHVLYDSLGGPYFERSLKCLRTRGDLVSYGLAAGPVPPFDVARLAGYYDADINGSLRISRTSLGDFVPTPDALRARAAALFADFSRGVLPSVPITHRFALADARSAHQAMQAGASGKILLIPSHAD